MTIVIAINADAASVGAKWAIVKWSNDFTDMVRSMSKTMRQGGAWTYVDEMVLANLCQVTILDKWPYKMVEPAFENNQHFILKDEPEYALSDAQFDRSIIRTDYERVTVSTYGSVTWLADFKHSAAYEGTIATYSLDIEDLKVV
jgi:hypothetical protein